MLNNFELIKKKLIFEDFGDFYYLQIFQRKKDGNVVHSSSQVRLIKSYYIRSIEDFINKQQEIISLCEKFNARAYIHYSKRSFRQVGRGMLRDITDKLLSENWQGMKSSFQHCCGMCVSKKYKTYLVDIDYDSDEYRTHGDDLINLCKDYINTECENFADMDKIIDMIPTNNGCHLICKPFNVSKFKDWAPSIEVKTNSPTLLYKA